MRRARRTLALTATAALLAAVVLDHLVGHRGDDGSRYDHRPFTVAAVLGGDAIQLPDGTPVRLLGISDPTPTATGWLTRSMVGHRVTLLLPTVGTRDPAGLLLAYVYDDADGSCVNVALVHGGLAYADRRATDAMTGLFDAAESDARRKRRGLWDGLRFDQMPPWRQAWLRSRSTSRPQ